MRLQKDSDYCIEYKNDGVWWSWKTVDTYEKASRLLRKAKNQGNGNRARILLHNKFEILEILKEI